MEFDGVLHQGGQIEDKEYFKTLPQELQDFYEQTNGLVAFQGGLTIRGCLNEPYWLSLKEACQGENALWKTYEELEQTDWMFAYDCCGDQYFLRKGEVFRLCAENGEIEGYGIDFWEFVESAMEEPEDYLDLQPLYGFFSEGGVLEPGELLHVYPPFIVENEEDGVQVAAAPFDMQMDFLKRLYLMIKDLDDEADIEIDPLDL
jgi:hypothetical protein